ncbi:MAG: Na+/H+ antiporter subunit E [Chloroflexota bacterium]|nr:Na+/H+ antiporter subunit E [Chloroflexota bacterium]
MSYLILIALFTLTYLALTSNFSPGNILLGLLMSCIIIALWRPRRRNASLRDWLVAGVSLVRYIAILIFDLVASGIQTARIVLDPRLPIHPGIIAIPCVNDTELNMALSAHAITLTPGELVVEIDGDGIMYTHCLDTSRTEENISDAQEMRRELLDKIIP